MIGGFSLMAKYFNTYTKKMTHQQMKSLYDEYHYAVNHGMYPGPLLSFKEFFNQENIFEMVSMKCLNCGFDLNVSYMNYHQHIINKTYAFPIETCRNCEKFQLVPKDVYNKLNS